MRQINLQEHQQSGPHALSKDQRDALREIPSLTIERADVNSTESQYYLTPGSTVGAVETDGLSVRIEPKIGVPSCFRWRAMLLIESSSSRAMSTSLRRRPCPTSRLSR